MAARRAGAAGGAEPLSAAPIEETGRTIWRPRLGRNVYLAPTAYVGGDVTLGDDCVLMHHVVVRGDVAAIRIGRGCNIQDGAIVHTKTGVPLDVAEDVAVGHRAVVHGRRVGARTLIGIGAIVLDDVELGEDCLVGAGAVVPPGLCVPAGVVLLGVPARPVRSIRPEERDYIRFVLDNYRELGRAHAAGQYPNAVPRACREGGSRALVDPDHGGARRPPGAG